MSALLKLDNGNDGRPYDAFLAEKVAFDRTFGFDVRDEWLSPIMRPGHPDFKPHQADIVKWAVKGGRRAIFARYGLGKSVMQLEILRLIVEHGPDGRRGVLGTVDVRRGLIVAPLGVRFDIIRDGRDLLDTEVRFIRSTAEVDPAWSGLYVTNYESVRDGKLDLSLFVAVSLDEAAVLRSYGSETYQRFLPLFADVPFRFVATATPAPNRHKELIHYAGFLGIMDTGQALTRFFKRDSSKAGNLKIHPHKKTEFMLWLNTWACFIQRPSDLGYSDDGYELPPLEVVWDEVEVGLLSDQVEKDGQGVLVRAGAKSAVESSREKRHTLDARIQRAMSIVTRHHAGSVDGLHQIILWCDLNDEQDALEAGLRERGLSFSSIRGAQSDAEVEEELRAWLAGDTYALIGKPMMLGRGLNLQQCSTAVFVGVTHKYEQTVQAIHRIHRFGQVNPCTVHLLYGETESDVRDNLLTKWQEDDALTDTMSEILREFGLNATAVSAELARAMGVDRSVHEGRDWRIVLNDSVIEWRDHVEAESMGLIVTSIPFGGKYEYSANYCYDETTEVLTRRGWISFGDLTLDDEVGTVHPEHLAFEWQKPTGTIWEPYVGQMLHFENRNNFDLLVTPDHNLFVDRRVGGRTVPRRYGKVRASDVAESFVPRKYRMINAAAGGTGDSPDRVVIPKLARAPKGPAPRVIESIGINDFMQLAGWYLSEGYCDPVDGPSGGRINIAQSDANPAYRDEIDALFDRIGLPARRGERSHVAHNKALAAFLVQEFGHGSYDKRIPQWVKDLHPSHLEVLRDTMMKGDGTKTGFEYTSVSQRLRDDFQFIALVTGWGTTISGDRVRIGQKQTFPEIRRSPETVEYDGMIGCATVPNGTLVVRRNGVVSVSGNCDFGHVDDNGQFWWQMDYLTPSLYRALMPGRILAVHVKDFPLYGSVTGKGVYTFDTMHAEAIAHYTGHGFDYFGMITVTTDVVRENNQTYRLSYSEMAKDHSKMGVGSPEYVLLFHKPQTDRSRGYADLPVTKAKADYSVGQWQIDAAAEWRTGGDRLLSSDELAVLDVGARSKLFTAQSERTVYDYDAHVALADRLAAANALPGTFASLVPGSWRDDVWTDVLRIDTLNSEQRKREVEAHICPFPLDIPRRLIRMYSNPGELVGDPFSGLGSTVLEAVRQGRRGFGSELNPVSVADSVVYLTRHDNQANTPTLFDLLDLEGGAA